MKYLPTKTKKMLVVSLAVAALFAMGSTAQAASITGSISFNGTLVAKDSVNNILTTSLSNATTLDFSSLNQYVARNTQNGSFAAIPNFTTVAFLTPFVFTTATPPTSPLWSVDGFSFELKNWTDTVTANAISINGTGILQAAGYTNAVGLFNFSTQAGGTDNLSFSASSQTTVPLPAAIFFVTPVLGGLFGWSRRKLSTASLSA